MKLLPLSNNATQLPVIAETDLLVVGSGLAGLAAAVEYARAGGRALVIEGGTYLGGTMTECMRPYLLWAGDRAELAHRWFPIREECPEEGAMLLLNMRSLKVKMEDVLREAGVQLLYASRPVEIARHGAELLVSIANKSGMQAVKCRKVLDVTDEGIISAIQAGTGSALRPGVSAQRCMQALCLTFEFVNIRERYAPSYELALENARVQARVRPGSFASHHVFVDLHLEAETTRERFYEEDLRLRRELNRLCLEAAAWLAKNEKAFEGAKLGSIARRVMRGSRYDPFEELAHGSSLGSDLLGAADGAIVSLNRREPLEEQAVPWHGEALEYRDENDMGAVRNMKRVKTERPAMPVLCASQVLVGGGGVCGAVAALASGRRGVDTVVFDMNAILGGAGTAGGVNMYWMSLPSHISDEIDRRVIEAQDKLGMPEVWLDYFRSLPSGVRYIWEKEFCWSMEIKAQVFSELLEEAGVRVYCDSRIVGALVKGNQVAGIALSTPYGPCAALADISLDATGDGDIAAFAGASFIYGSSRDRFTMWTALSPYCAPATYQGNFYAPVDVEDALDYTRFIITSRKRPPDLPMHDHAPYVVPRESRHIEGDIVVTLKDLLSFRRYEDTIAVFFSNFDLKGKVAADVVIQGICPPNMEIEIPFRALLPRGLENLIVAGRAFSVTHDAQAGPRMQKDMQCFGAAAGLAAAEAALKGVAPRALDLKDVRARLIREGNLAHAEPYHAEDNAPREALEEVISCLTGEEPFDWLLMHSNDRSRVMPPVARVFYADASEAVPLLEQAYRGASGEKRLMLARMLAWHGNSLGEAEIAGAIWAQFDAVRPLPKRTGDAYFINTSPNQQAVPEVIFLLNSYARMKSKACLPLFSELAERLHASQRDYWESRGGIFDYIECVGYTADRLGYSEFVPILKRLLELPELRESRLVEGEEVDIIRERHASLALYLLRAIARCGCRDGLLGLAELTSDLRAMVSKNALMELKLLTGQDYGLDSWAWLDALKVWPEEYEPIPWTEVID